MTSEPALEIVWRVLTSAYFLVMIIGEICNFGGEEPV
jgi:hypothetical protein